MKKLFALLLACIMLFLTACNETPPNETTTNNLPNETTGSQNPEIPNESELKDVIIKYDSRYFIETPSRILFESTTGDGMYTFYYSKADGKAYVYCFDPLCDHAGEKCLAHPRRERGREEVNLPEFTFWCTAFINNRFYTVTRHGQIYSFGFDGSDLKIEYGPKFFTPEEVNSLQFT